MLKVMRDKLQSRYLHIKSCAETISANVLKFMNSELPVCCVTFTLTSSDFEIELHSIYNEAGKFN